jgi:hypothetical protein
MKINSNFWFRWRIAVSLGLFVFIAAPIIITALVVPSTDKMLNGQEIESDYKFDISLSRINVGENSAIATITPRFTGNFGEPTNNGSITFKDIELVVDSYQGSGKFSSEIGQLVGRQEFKLLLNGNSWRYPFDGYKSYIGLLDAKFDDQPLALT